ncbi:MAG TPA: hypothetical protein VMT68_07495 [Caulobacteraceae bacterium]|nr:hypothetical protein [Caulobacteraceae bacterium]
MLEQRETATKTALEAIPFGAPVETVMEAYRRDGGLILEGVLTEAQVAQVIAPCVARRAGLAVRHAEP